MKFIEIQESIINSKHIIRILRKDDTTIRVKCIQNNNDLDYHYIDKETTDQEYQRLLTELDLRKEYTFVNPDYSDFGYVSLSN